MAPHYLKTGLLRVVGHILLAVDGVLIAGQERTAVAITLAIVRGSREAPRAFGIDFTYQLQVHLIVDGKIVTTIAQIETTLGLITIGRHDESA